MECPHALHKTISALLPNPARGSDVHHFGFAGSRGGHGGLWPLRAAPRRQFVLTFADRVRRTGYRQPVARGLEHDPEKCAAVFRKDHGQSKS
jgi:hypothetical protein